MTEGCPFCEPDPARVFYEDALVLALWDGYPVSPGHALVITRRHVADWFAAGDVEQQAITRALETVRRVIEERHAPDGYNLGTNAGPAAGQTVPHLHVHVIPRYRGDVADPRGGVRWVVPGKAAYWDDDG